MIFGRNVLAIGSLAILFLAVLALGDSRLQGQDAGAAGAAAKPATPPPSGKYEIMPAMEILLQDTQEGKKTLRDGEKKIAAVLRGTEPLESNTRAVQVYYGQYFFPRLTHPKYLGEWPSSRKKFIEQQLGVRTIPRDVHQYLIDLARQIMTTIVRGNYHPVARANAMLLLGSLNADEAVLVGDSKRPPVPLTAALGVMFQELDKPQQADGVRAAALAGILRHVKIDGQWPATSRQLSGATPSQKNREKLIATAMLKWANGKEPPEGRSRGGHDWLRRRAIEVLGLLGSPGQGNSVVTSLENILVDNDESLSVRCAAAEALGSLNLPQNGAIDAKGLATKIATVAVLACRKEISRVEDLIAKEEEAKASGSPYGGGMGGGMGGGYGGGFEDSGGYGDESGYGSMMGGAGGMDAPGGMGMGAPGDMGMGMGAPGGMGMGGSGGMGMGGYGSATATKFNPLGYRMILTRRRIKSQLVLLKEGLVGPDGPQGEGKGALARATEGEQKDYVDKAIKGIDDIIAIIDANEETEMEPMIEKLSGAVQLLENNCEIVVTLPGEEGDGMLDEGLLNPLGLPDGISSPDTPMDTPPVAPATPATPAAGTPPAEEPGLGDVPAGQPPAGEAPTGGPPAATPPAAGATPE